MKTLNRKKNTHGGKELGFTLIEVLVALVITGTVITVFFQVLSAGMKLEYSASERTEQVVDLTQAYSNILSQDVQDEGFEWEGEYNGSFWNFRIEHVETLKTHSETDESFNLDTELYRYVFEFTKGGRDWQITRLMQHDPDFFSDDFKRTYLN